jgi:hypothetical protein
MLTDRRKIYTLSAPEGSYVIQFSFIDMNQLKCLLRL